MSLGKVRHLLEIVGQCVEQVNCVTTDGALPPHIAKRRPDMKL